MRNFFNNITTALFTLPLQFRIYEPLIPFFGTTSILYGLGYTFLPDIFFNKDSNYAATLHKWTMTQEEYLKTYTPYTPELQAEGEKSKKPLAVIPKIKKRLSAIYQNKLKGLVNGKELTKKSETDDAITLTYKQVSEALQTLKDNYEKANKKKSEKYKDYSVIGKIQQEIEAVKNEEALLKALVDVQTNIDAASSSSIEYKNSATKALALMKKDNTLVKYAGHMQEIQKNTKPFYDKNQEPQKNLKAKFSSTISNLIKTKKEAIDNRLNAIYSARVYKDKWEFEDILNYLRLPAVGLGLFKFYYYDWTKLIASGIRLPVINLWSTNIDLGILPAFALRYWAINFMSKIIFGEDNSFFKLTIKSFSDITKLLSFTSGYLKFYSINAINYTKIATLSAGNLPAIPKFSLTINECAILSVQIALIASTMFIPMSTSIQALYSFNPIVAQGSFMLSALALLLENSDYYRKGAIANIWHSTSGLVQYGIIGVGLFTAAPNLVQGNIPAVVLIAIGTTITVAASRQVTYMLEQKWNTSDIYKSMTLSNFALSGAAFGIPIVGGMYIGAPITGLAIGAATTAIMNLFIEKAEKKQNNGKDTDQEISL